LGLDSNHETNSRATGQTFEAFSKLKSQLIKILKAGHGSEYTSPKRALLLVDQGKAEWVTPTTIAFHEPEYLPAKSQMHTDGKIPGSFEWHVRESAGFQVLQADHNIRL
jgi:hypothetical protein